MPIILVRHGETLLNAARVFQPFDTDLGPRGIEQAKLAADRIAQYQPVAILCSDMPRAHTTARHIAQACRLTPTTTTLLHERNFGDWRGQRHETLQIDPNTFVGTPPNGESTAVFSQRVAEAFAKAVEMRQTLNGPLVVVSHGLVIQNILQNCVSLGQHVMPERIANTSITVIETEAPFNVTLLNCTRHLHGTSFAEDSKSLSGG